MNRIVFGHTTINEAIGTALSHAAIIETIRTALSHAAIIETIRTAFSHAAIIETIRTALSHAAIIEPIRTILSHQWYKHAFTRLIPDADLLGRQRHRTCAQYRQGDSNHHVVNLFHDSVSVIGDGFVAGCQCKA